jgi:hypothetical protein
MNWNNKVSLQLDGCEVKTDLLWWQKKGLNYTATGYGHKIPTTRKVWYKGKWRRIYCTIYSNIGTCWIVVKGSRQIVY